VGAPDGAGEGVSVAGVAHPGAAAAPEVVFVEAVVALVGVFGPVVVAVVVFGDVDPEVVEGGSVDGGHGGSRG
jgi:hypothetical protein